MRQKRLMLLGGIRYLLPVIETAHQLGYYVITADYLPDNIAHKYSDEYVNVSIIDKSKVLEVAREKHIDGIMSFGVDPGVVAAAYVQDRLRLPSFGPYESVEILQNKDRFRAFLENNGFNVPKSNSYQSLSEVIQDSNNWSYPVMIKPVDSAGSKGVFRVNNYYDLVDAAEKSFSYSKSHRIIVEDFIKKKGYSSDSDCFLKDGVLKYVSFSSQRFDSKATNPYTPAAYSWPSSFSYEQEQYLSQELQRLLSLLNMRTGVFNVETCVGVDNKPYLMEVTPRGGGNRLSEMIRYGAGVDLIRASIQSCVGDSIDVISQNSFSGYWAEVMIHANKKGVFNYLEISNKITPFIIEKDIWVKAGEFVNEFNGANDCIGSLILRFDSEYVLEEAMSTIDTWLSIIVS